MGRAALCMRAAALLAAAGMFIFLAEGISADNDIAEAVAARVLEPTELVAEIPEEFGTLFQIQWGGGGLPQLRGRLAGRGCALNTLWVYGEDGWHGYNRYDLPQEFPLNRQFIEQYEQDVPAGTLYATCADQPVAQDLQPTQIVADIPEEYDTLFKLQWGGGSLYQLKGRLATMGCIANNISFTDPETNREYTYNQYNTRSTDPTNQQFLQQYEQFIPAGTLTADCYNVCEFGGERCLSFDELREQESNFREYFSSVYILRINNFEIDETTPCTQEFHPTIQEHILPLLPIRPDTCVVRKEKISPEGYTGGIGGYTWYRSVNALPFFVMSDTSSLWYRSTQEYKDLALVKEVHEFCHMNQTYQQVQGLTAERSFNEDDHTWFKNSPQGKAFIDMIGFIDLGYWQWKLSHGNTYRDIFSKNPIELSAELCSMYLLDKIGATQRYEKYEKWTTLSNGNGYFEPFSPIPNFNVNTYLTPEIRQWLETYMILPEIPD